MNPLAVPEIIAFAGDWHMNLPWAKKAVEYAANNQADIMLHLGDFGYTFEPKFMKELNAILAKYKLPMAFVDGNHDDHEWIYAHEIQRRTGLRKMAEFIYHIPRGKRWAWDGVRFMGMGGAHSVDRQYRLQSGAMWSYMELISEKDARKANRGQVDVILSHECPAGVPIPNLSKTSTYFPADEIKQSEAHREFFAAAIVQKVKPSLLLHGHYHRKYDITGDFLGYGPLRVIGLDCDGTTMQDNIKLMRLRDIKKAIS